MKILVVDDEKLLVKGMKFNLENEGYEVECVLEGLGQIPAVRDIYVEHVQAAMEKLGE